MCDFDMRNIDWIIVILHPMWVQSEDFAGTLEQAKERVVLRAIETERRVTAHSEYTDTVIDSATLDFWF